MRVERIPYQQTNCFSKFILDYLSGEECLSSFYHRAPKLSNFKVQIQEKDESVIKDMTVTMRGLGVPSIPNHSVTVE